MITELDTWRHWLTKCANLTGTDEEKLAEAKRLGKLLELVSGHSILPEHMRDQ